MEAFNSIGETAHLLSTPANTERLIQSIAQDKAGKVVMKQLEQGNEKKATRSSKMVLKKRQSKHR